tara:strand:+ start:616 stop:756 length:141 start_codon:yes stop_codon:yes gene_type:complete
MKKLSNLVFFVFLILLISGGVFLATWDIPAPSKILEKRIPDARFPK